MANEFLRQELAEEELALRVQQKVQVDPNVEIDEVLETIGSEENERVEKVGSWSRWLAGSYGKAARVHWLVAIGYISAPVIECLCFVAATEWGIRAKGIQLDVVQIEDPAYVSMALFTINSLAYAIGAPIWTKLAMYVQPRCLLAAAQLLRLLLLAAVFPVQPSFVLACVLMGVQGLVSSASMLFMVFNFMLSIQADMSKAAIRLGILEVVRYCIAWVLTGYIFLASPSSRSGTAEKPLPTSVLLLLMPVVVCLLVTSLVPGLLLLAAPGPYKDDRFPGWDLGLVWKRKSFIFLSLSDCVGSLGLYPGAAYVAWWVDNGWTEEQLALSSVLIGILLGVGMAFWALALHKASVHGMSFLVGIVLLMAPPVLLRALVVEEVSTKISLGRSEAAMTLIAFSLLLEGIRNSATWTARIRVLGSRWRLLSYGTVALTVAHWMSVLSPALCEVWAKKFYAVSFVSRNQKELADATIVCLVPICIAQFMLQVLAAPFIHSDLGLGGREEQASCWQSARRTLSSRYAFVACACLSVGVGLLAKAMLDKAIPLDLMHHCQEGLQPECTLIFDESNTRKATIDSWTYGPNRYGQSTTGRYNCHRRMRNLNGDTFRFWEYGRCQVFDCRGGRLVENGTASGDGLDGEVWSRLCPNSGQNLVAVHLFEWPWRDIAHECRAYLGPAGISMVQISPPAEHILGDSWAIRYQPVSYKLESRSGTREEFIEMVAACTEAGVQVMVDAVVNHMAGPFVYSPKQDRGKQCGHDQNTSETSTQQCVGWIGTEYSDRYFPNGNQGLDAFERRHFHHYPDNDRANCGLPPWTNDNYLCDLNGLPDLDTESLETQSMVTGFLLELYEIGVTMLRVDAAMLMYPESLHQMLEPIPWQYIVQEYYPDHLANSRSRSRVFAIGSVTEFVFGQRVAESLFDSGNPDYGYTNRSYALYQLMQIADEPYQGCVYRFCRTPVPSAKALIFLDNHDQQRERWKPDDQPQPFRNPDAVCDWDGLDPGNCRPIYKHGMQYNLAQRFMLVWPYGDAARIMSSFAWANFDDGPPGVPKDSLRQNTPPVACGGSPRESPVLPENDRGWVCEHRWQGLLAMVRLRRLMGYGHRAHSTWSEDGFMAFSRGKVAFFAFSRGWNWWTKMGSNATLNLTGFQTPLPAGSYCNLALELGPLPEPERWSTECTGGDPLEVDEQGKILVGMVEPGDMVAIHINYTTGSRPGPILRGRPPRLPQDERVGF